MFYHGLKKQWAKEQGCVYTTPLDTGPILNMILRTAHAMNKIITQADVRMKKLLPTRVSLGFGTTDVHDTNSLHVQKCEVRTPVSKRPHPVFLSADGP